MITKFARTVGKLFVTALLLLAGYILIALMVVSVVKLFVLWLRWAAGPLWS